MLDLAFAPALLLAGWGAFLDIRERRLPNWLCASLAVAAAGGLVFSEGVEPLPWALLHGLIALIVGMALFAAGMIGGGDAKFYAAAALSVPATSLPIALELLGWTSLAGLILLLIMMIWRRTRSAPESRSLFKGWEVPYGVAIAAGLWLTILNV